MIKLFFEKQGQYFIITIENKVIKYWDKNQGQLWGGPLQYLPPDSSITHRIDMSRNRIPAVMKEFFKIAPEELKEFEDANSDEELKDIVIRDCKRHGCKLIDMKIE